MIQFVISSMCRSTARERYYIHVIESQSSSFLLYPDLNMSIAINITYLLIALAIIVIILSNVELSHSKRSSALSMELPKTSFTIDPNKFGTKYPITIYNTNLIKRRQLKLQTNADILYVKHEVPVHIASKITQPIKDMWSIVKTLPFTKMPINTLYSGLNKSDTLLTTINPLINPDKGKYRMLIAKEDVGKVEAFIDDKLYFIK